MKKVLLLGASGSIGGQTLDIIRDNPSDFTLVAFSVGKQTEKIDEILKDHHEVRYVYLIDASIARKYKKLYPNITFFYGDKGLLKLVKKADYEMCVEALVGFVGLEPAIYVLKRNKILCLANKEALVTGGHIINGLLKRGKGKLYPIDSEHVAIAKCLAHTSKDNVDKIILTASGGALRKVPLEDLPKMKASDALKHPTWKMGAKITIDCATMMNKGFEIIEAYYLFHYPLGRIKVMMHDESLVHSMVKTKDGRYIIDYGKPDMHNPIRYAMYEGKAYTDVIEVKDLKELKDCHFHRYNPKRYPATEVAKKALQKGGAALVALNASNEVLVHAFLEDKISFDRIATCVNTIVENTPKIKKPRLSQIKFINDISIERVEEVIKL